MAVYFEGLSPDFLFPLAGLNLFIVGIMSWLATIISLVTIWFHLKNYKRPDLQRYTIRIIMMVPIYSLSAWISLLSITSRKYLYLIREIYEAFVLYMFFCLLVGFMDGERELIQIMTYRESISVGLPLSLCFKPINVPIFLL